MAVSASFHRNVLLLSQIIQPNDEFKKHFREGMFDKPNSIGFIHVSHYLLTIYDSARFKKLVEWPVICKKTEVKYRNNVKDYLTSIAVENPDLGFPNILMSHLILAGGNKFTIIMWKLSSAVLRKYITRETSYNITLAPQTGITTYLAKKFHQETNAKTNFNILNCHRNLSAMDNATKFVLKKRKEMLSNIVTEIFEREHSVETLSDEAPVHPSIKKRLRDINEEEVIQMWKTSINNRINHIQKKNSILGNIEQLGSKANNIIPSNSYDIKALDVKEIQKISCLEILELFSVNIQCLLLQSHKSDKLILNKFIVLFKSLLTLLHQRLEINIEDFSKCSLQLEASCKDMKTALNIIQSYQSDVTKLLSESQIVARQMNVIQVSNDTALPMISNVLLMSSPDIRFDTNYTNEEMDLQKRLQLTPVEGVHKSLFSRYERLKQNHTSHIPKLRENLSVSRMNLDDVISTVNNDESSSLRMQTISRRNLASFKPPAKYSRLFSNLTSRSNRSDSSIMSMRCSSKANSTAIVNTIEEMHISEFNLNMSAKSLCHNSKEFVTPVKLTVRQNEHETTPETENMIQDFPNKLNILDICETMGAEINSDNDNNHQKTEETKQRRRSISDLVERYKKLLELSNRTSNSKINIINENQSTSVE